MPEAMSGSSNPLSAARRRRALRFDVDGGGSKAALLQDCTVGLEHGLRERSTLFLLVPSQEVIDSAAVSALGVGHRDAVDDEGPEGRQRASRWLLGDQIYRFRLSGGL
jgi:hypothetical protein